jgi:MFS family permease
MSDSSPAPRLLARPFVLFALGRAFSTIGNQVKNVAVGWQVYTLTGNPLDLGWIGLVHFATAITLGLTAGASLDRLDRRKVWIGCQIAKLVCYSWLLFLTLSGTANLWLILMAVAGLGAAQGLELPATQSLLPLVVDRTHLPRAIATQSSVMEAATLVGPAIGGFLIAVDLSVGYGLCVVASVTTWAVGMMMRLHYSQTFDQSLEPGLSRFLAGLRFLWAHPPIWGAVTLDMVAVLLGGVTSLLPIFSRDILHVGADGMGLLRAAMSLGALTCAALLARWPIRRYGGKIMFGAVALFGLATIVFSLSTNFYLSCLLMIVMGIADEISVFSRATLVQLSTPDEVRGRVSAVNGIFITTSNQLGEFESGATAALFGVVPAAVLGGFGTLLVAGLWAYWFPALRRVEDLTKGVAISGK